MSCRLRRARSRRDAAVSDVLSNTFLVGMTVVLMSVVALAIAPKLGPDPMDHATIGVEATRTTLHLVHQGGDPIALNGARVHMLVDGAPVTLELATFAASLGDAWGLGERVCISGTTSDCADYGGATITELTLVARAEGGGALQASTSWSGSVTALTPPS